MADEKRGQRPQQQQAAEHAAGVVKTQEAEVSPPKPARVKKDGPKPGSPGHEISVMHRMTKLMGELSPAGRKRVMTYLRSVDDEAQAPVDAKPGQQPPY